MKSYLFVILSALLAALFPLSLKADTRPEISPALLRQIQSDFLQLTQPLSFIVKIKDSWAGIDALQREFGARPFKVKKIVLSGDALEFKVRYPAGSIAIALYPYFTDSEHDAEACIIMLAVLNESLPQDFTTFRSRSEPGNWSEVRNKELRLTRPSTANLGRQSYHWSITSPAYKVAPNEILPSSLKKKSRRGLLSRLFQP